jgi:hypothetical protein
MTMPTPAGVQTGQSSLRINGRLIRHQDFFPRFQTMCNLLGFSYESRAGEICCTQDGASQVHQGNAQNSFIMLSCKVNYNPNWGGLGGHPQLLAQQNPAGEELCPTTFLAPFLRLYTLAQRQIYLTCSETGDCFISVPARFLDCDGEEDGCHLNLVLDRIVELGVDGTINPVESNGMKFLYKVSRDFKEFLHTRLFEWIPGRKNAIGQYLSKDLFVYKCSENAVDRDSPFISTLFPYLRQIVTHGTPHLRAAEIHLQQEYSRVIACASEEKQSSGQNLVCVAGVIIDMSSLAGHTEKYFVPWKAYLEKTNKQHPERCSLDQDDLFVKLMH